MSRPILSLTSNHIQGLLGRLQYDYEWAQVLPTPTRRAHLVESVAIDDAGDSPVEFNCVDSPSVGVKPCALLRQFYERGRFRRLRMLGGQHPSR